jgi:hypothetical protein
MPLTYESIATQTLGTATASVTFSSIPSTYTDLVLMISVRSTRTGDPQDFPSIRFNSDSATNYSRTSMQGTGATANSSRFSNESYLYGPFISTASAASGVFTPVIYNIQNYSNATTNKTVVWRSSQSENNVMAGVGLWRKAPEAITSIAISLAATGLNFAADSTFTLYGIKAA